MIPDGMRAFTIQTPHVAADVGGFIMPGNHVDILLTTCTGNDDTAGGGVTTTLLQNVQVLAVAQKLEAPEDSKLIANDIKSVTLLVTPNQAARLDLGMNKGILHLALRNPADDREAKTVPATMKTCGSHQEKPLNLADWWRSCRAGAAPGSDCRKPRSNRRATRKSARCGAWTPARCGLPSHVKVGRPCILHDPYTTAGLRIYKNQG